MCRACLVGTGNEGGVSGLQGGVRHSHGGNERYRPVRGRGCYAAGHKARALFPVSAAKRMSAMEKKAGAAVGTGEVK